MAGTGWQQRSPVCAAVYLFCCLLQVDTSARVAYDDVNESLCIPSVVKKVRCSTMRSTAAACSPHTNRPPAPPPPPRTCAATCVPQTLARLGVQWDKRTRQMRVPKDLYAALLSVGDISISTSATAGAANGGSANGAGPGGSAVFSYDPASARDWWGTFVFGKTYVERRSLLTMYRWVQGLSGWGGVWWWLFLRLWSPPRQATCLPLNRCRCLCHASAPAPAPLGRTFFRVWAFLILEFHFMAVMNWGYKNWFALSSVALDHALLSLIEQVAGAWTQRSPGREGGGAPASAAIGGGRCGRVHLPDCGRRRGWLDCVHWPTEVSARSLCSDSALPLQPRACACWAACSGIASAAASSTGWPSTSCSTSRWWRRWVCLVCVVVVGGGGLYFSHRRVGGRMCVDAGCDCHLRAPNYPSLDAHPHTHAPTLPMSRRSPTSSASTSSITSSSATAGWWWPTRCSPSATATACPSPTPRRRACGAGAATRPPAAVLAGRPLSGCWSASAHPARAPRPTSTWRPTR